MKRETKIKRMVAKLAKNMTISQIVDALEMDYQVVRMGTENAYIIDGGIIHYSVNDNSNVVFSTLN